MAKKSANTETYIYIRHTADREHGWFEGVFLAKTEPVEGMDTGFRNASDRLINGLFLDDLIVYGLYTVGREAPRVLPLYPDLVVYRRPYNVDLDIAEKMLRTLKAIDRKLVKIRERDGFTDDYVTFLQRVAEATDSKIVTATNEGIWLSTAVFTEMTSESLREFIASYR